MRLFRYSLFLCFFVVCIAFAGCSYPSDVGRGNLPIGTISPEETRPICKVHGYTVKIVPSTCTETGLCVRTCINCGDCIDEELPLAEHKPSEKVEGKDTVCTVCGKVLAKADHVHKYVEKVTDSTCTKQGEKVERCECGDVKSTTKLPLADHKPSATVAAKDTVCTVCGKVLEKHTHQYTKTTTASTCTKQGEEVEKCACGDTKTTKLPLADHKPSATVAGKDIVCTVCGKVLEQGMKPTTGTGLSAGEVYQNAYDNISELDEHRMDFELSMMKKLLIGKAGIEMRGSLQSADGEAGGTAVLEMPAYEGEFEYQYPYDVDTAVFVNANRKGLIMPFDLAGFEDGLVPNFSNPICKKMQFVDSSRETVTVSLNNEEVWASYEDILNFLIDAAKKKMDLNGLEVTEATVTVSVRDGILHTVDGGFKAKAGKQNIEISFSATYNKIG